MEASQGQREGTKVAMGAGEGAGGGSQIGMGHCPLPVPSQEVWRSSFLHHSNRCSCFHWPGASLMLLAVLLLLGCCGGQPAGRYAPRGCSPTFPAVLSVLLQHLGRPGLRGGLSPPSCSWYVREPPQSLDWGQRPSWCQGTRMGHFPQGTGVGGSCGPGAAGWASPHSLWVPLSFLPPAVGWGW